MRKEKIEAIITANEYIDKLINGINGVCEKIHNDEQEEGILLLPQIVEGLEYIFKIIELTRDILDNIEYDKAVTPYLEEIIEGMENEDYTLVADVYEYEVIPVLNNIKKSFVKVISN
ncbi:MAG: hypothetical protein ACRC30_05250 [Clostridium sp.]